MLLRWKWLWQIRVTGRKCLSRTASHGEEEQKVNVGVISLMGDIAIGNFGNKTGFVLIRKNKTYKI